MKIAMVSEHASPLACLGDVDAGGQNVHVAALSAALADRGHQVTVYTRRDDPELADQVAFGPGVHVEHLAAGPSRQLPKDELLPHMDAFGALLRRRWSLSRPDVVHAHFWMSGLAALNAATALEHASVPVAQTFHALGTVKRRWQGADDTSPPERIGIERRIARTADRIIATCGDERAELLKLGAKPQAIDVIPCGVDTELFSPDGRESTDGTESMDGTESTDGTDVSVAVRSQRSGRSRILAIGRLVPRKGVDDVIRALVRLPLVELLIAGGPPADRLHADPEALRLRQLAAAHGVSGRVRLLGQVGHAQLPALIRSAEVVVSAPWYEPFGIVPLEAMACGVPVVATAVGGMLDTVVPSRTGLLVPPRNPVALATALAQLLADPQLRARLGAAGAQRARESFSWNVVAAATERSYLDIIETSAAARMAFGVSR
jgi:D-inositol-3-phosphate glycosyltransferase